MDMPLSAVLTPKILRPSYQAQVRLSVFMYQVAQEFVGTHTFIKPIKFRHTMTH